MSILATSSEIGDFAMDDWPDKPKKKYRYLFILVADKASLFINGERLISYLENIAFNMGEGYIFYPTPGKEDEKFALILSKNWGDQEDLIRTSVPSLLVIDKDGSSFDPTVDKWALVRLSDLYNDQGQFFKKRSEDFARKVIKITKDPKLDLFYYLDDVEFRNKIMKIGNLISIGPSGYGISVDVKSFLKLF